MLKDYLKLSCFALGLCAFNAKSQTSAYEIGTWEDFKDAAITFTFDDCLANQYKTAVPLLDKYGFNASFYVVTNWINSGSSNYYTWTNAKSMLASGHEIGSHTVSHANLNGSDYIDQMANSQSTIDGQLGSGTCTTIVYPNCIVPSSETECGKYYLGGRICNGQVEGSTPSDYFQIGSLICGNQGSYNSTSAFTTAFQTAKSKKGWAVFLIHELDNGSGYSPLSSSILNEVLSYLKTNNSNYWVNTFGNVIRYSKERNAGKISELTNTASSITMTVTDNLDNSLYNYPLSLRRTLPSGWTSVTVTQGSKSTEATVSNGYIYFSVIPDGGVVTLEPTSTEELPTAAFTEPATATSWQAGTTQTISWTMSGASKSNNILNWVSAGSSTISASSAEASSTWCTDDKSFCWEAENINSEDENRWAANASSFSGEWVSITLSKTSTVAGAIIDECTTQDGTISSFEIQYDNGDGTWRTAYTGTTIGAMKTVTFSPVTATKLRLYIKSATNVNVNYFAALSQSSTTLSQTIGSDGSYQWEIPSSLAGTTGNFVLTTATGSKIAESAEVTITSGSSQSESGSGSSSSSVTIEGGYTGPSCDGEGTGAYYTGIYKNLFVDVLGKTETEVQSKVDQVWKHFFTPGSSTSVYYEVGDDMAYIYDTGNEDVRTEGMSYGMMICVQLNHQTEFDKIWRWAKKYMQYQSGNWDGYFAWQCNTDGSVKGSSCAPDGEEYFITALLFASNRWGNSGDIDYNAEAQNILTKIMNKTGNGGVTNMYNSSNHMVTFCPYYSSAEFSDPSYCLPGFMELWARWSETNNDFWAEAATAARTLLKESSHTTTGLFPDYCDFSGQPTKPDFAGYDTKQYKYDAIRCAMNVGMDYNWFRTDSANQTAMMNRLMTFFKNDGYSHGYFDWDGNNASGSYSEGMAGANGVGCFAVTDASLQKEVLTKFWNTSAPSGQWRYYNGMVYFLSLLHTSGNFKIYKPAPETIDTTVYNEFNGVTYTEPTTFTTNIDCKIYNVNVLIDSSSLSKNESNKEISIIPNPAKDVIKVNTSYDIKNAQVYDLTGRMLINSKSNIINVAALSNGIYLIKVETADNNSFITKFTKQ